MILPCYENPKTVCIQCWRRLSIPPEVLRLQNNTDMNLGMWEEFTILSTTATEFLAQGGYYYPWELIQQRLIKGYDVYKRVWFSYSLKRRSPKAQMSKTSSLSVIFAGTSGLVRLARDVLS